MWVFLHRKGTRHRYFLGLCSHQVCVRSDYADGTGYTSEVNVFDYGSKVCVLRNWDDIL